MLKTGGLTFAYDTGTEFRFPDIECGNGEHWLIIGPSGCGKTTLMHIIAGLLKPTGGSIEISGQDLSKLSGAAMDRFRGQHVGVVFQKPHLIKSLNVAENLELAAKLAGTSVGREELYALLHPLQVWGQWKSKVNELSQGEQQRVSIARALINKPTLLLADEPTSALDDNNCHAVIDLLEEQSKLHNSTLLIVTHDQRLKDRFTNTIDL